MTDHLDRPAGVRHAEPDIVPAVRVREVSKRFRIPREQVHTLKERALHPLRRRDFDALEALREVSFDVEKGEFFGIVGRNGSGKSTLLKCLASVYRADAGTIHVNGRLSTFIELGVGFNMDLAAHDNVVLNATMLGLNTREARDRFDRIIDFAELHDFVDLKLKNYSSGMLVRLAFSIMIQVDADVLLIDEVLAVGDAAFQQKCFAEFHRIRRSGATVLLVTHDMSAVSRFCDRALLLEHGKVAEIGPPDLVGSRYLELNFSSDARDREAGRPQKDSQANRFGDRRAGIEEAWFETADGTRTDVLTGGTPCSLVMRVRFAEDVDDPLFGFELMAPEEQRPILAFTSALGAQPLGRFSREEEVIVRFRFDNVVAPGAYEANLAIARDGGWIDRRLRELRMTVVSTAATGAYVDVPAAIAIERQGRTVNIAGPTGHTAT